MDNNSPITQVNKVNLPITQADQDKRDDSGFNSPRIKKDDEDRSTKKKRTPFIRRIFCCVSAQVDESEGNDRVEEPPEPKSTIAPLLGPPIPQHEKRIALVLDLDETLVHSSFKPVPNADFIIPVEIEGQVHQVFVLKRPGVDQFMKRMGDLYEVIVFTASLAKYADPLLDLLDKDKVIASRLFREACTNLKGNYVKDLSLLGRPIKSCIIIDNSPASYALHPEHAVPVESWFDDMNDKELYDLIPILEDLSKEYGNVVNAIERYRKLKWGKAT